MAKRDKSMIVAYVRRKVQKVLRELAAEIRAEAEEQEDLFARQDLMELANLVEGVMDHERE